MKQRNDLIHDQKGPNRRGTLNFGNGFPNCRFYVLSDTAVIKDITIISPIQMLFFLSNHYTEYYRSRDWNEENIAETRAQKVPIWEVDFKSLNLRYGFLNTLVSNLFRYGRAIRCHDIIIIYKKIVICLLDCVKRDWNEETIVETASIKTKKKWNDKKCLHIIFFLNRRCYVFLDTAVL